MTAPRVLPIAAALVAVLWSPAAFADRIADAPPEREEADAATIFAEGRQRYDEGRFEQALVAFRRVLDVAPSPNARLYVGRSLRRLGRLAEAYNELRRAAQDANRRAATEPRYQVTRESAREEAATLVGSVAFVSLVVTGAPPGAEVMIDGQRTGPALWTQPLARMPARARIEARAEGMQPITIEVDLRAATETRVRIPFAPVSLEGAVQMGFANDSSSTRAQGVETVAVDRQALDASMGERSTRAPDASRPIAPPPAPAQPASSAWVPVGGVAVGLGVASTVTGVVFAVLGNQRFGELSARCNQPGSMCHLDPAVQSRVNEGRTFDLVAAVTIAAGVTTAVAGAGMVLGGVLQNEANRSAAAVMAPVMVRVVPTATFGRDGLELGARGSF